VRGAFGWVEINKPNTRQGMAIVVAVVLVQGGCSHPDILQTARVTQRVWHHAAVAAAAAAGCCRYTGSQGIYTHTVAYERNAQCPVCSPGVELNAPADSTLQQVRRLHTSGRIVELLAQACVRSISSHSVAEWDVVLSRVHR
jgi:metal-dependent hydrolase (beta-lactamase superfamily II)